MPNSFSFEESAQPSSAPAGGQSFSFEDAAPPAPPSGPIGYIAQQAKAGLTADVPQMVGKALQYAGADTLGGKLRAVGEENAQANAPDASRGPITRMVAGVARGVAPFIPLAAANLTPAGPAVDMAAVPGLAATFGGSQAQDTFEKAKAAGLSDADATSAARKTGLITGVGMGAVSALTGGAAAPVARAIAGEGAGFVRPFLAEQATHLVGNVGSMAAANAGTAAVENNAGIPGGQTPGEAALEGAGTGLGFTVGMLPFGAMRTAMAMRAQQPAPGPITRAAGLLPAPTVHVDAAGRAKMDGVPSAGFDTGQQEGVVGRAPEDTNWPQLANQPVDQLLTFPDGTTARRSEVEAYIASLPQDQQIPARAQLLGMAAQPADGPIAQAASLAPRLPAPTITVDDEGTASTTAQRQGSRDAQAQEAAARGGLLETGAIGQGRNDDSVQPNVPMLPAPAVTVDQGGTATTPAQRQAQRDAEQQAFEARAGLRETGAIGRGRNGEDVTDVQPKTDQAPGPFAPGDVAVDQHFQDVHQAATSPLSGREEPTPAQKAAGNYSLGHIKIGGLDISVENPQGTVRSGTGSDGKPWQTLMQSHYGYIRRTEGADGDHVDVFVKPGTPHDFDGDVYVVNQKDPKTGAFDEHKALLGPTSEEDARNTYLANYSDGWKGLGSITKLPMADFKTWLRSDDTKKPLGEQDAHTTIEQPTGEPAAAAPDRHAAPAAATNEAQPAGDRVAVPARDAAARGPGAVAPREEAQPTRAKGLRVGNTPADAEPVTVRDGIIHVGKYPAVDYDSGEPIKAPPNATAPQIAKALRDAGALSKKQRVFGASEPAAEEAPKQEKPAGPARYGRDGVDVSKGGEPFKTDTEAAAFKRENMPQARVVKAPGGFVLRDVTDAELAARAKGGSRLQQTLRAQSIEKNPLLAFLAEHGMFHDPERKNSLKSEFSPDADVSVKGYRTLFRPEGLQLDALAERAEEAGFLPRGDHNTQRLSGLIQRALGGERIAPVYAHGGAEQEIERRQQEHAQLHAHESEAQLPDHVAAELEHNADDIPWGDVASNATMADAMRALGFTDEEISHAAATAEGPEGAPADGQRDRGPVEGAGAHAQDHPGRREGAPPEGQAQGLTDLLGEAPNASLQEAERLKAQAEDTQRRQQQAAPESSEFTLSGSDRPADVAAAHGQQDLLSGEQAPDIEAQIAEMLDPKNSRTSVHIPAGVDIPESALRAQMDRRKDPGYTMSPPDKDGAVVLSSTTKRAGAPAAGETAKTSAPATITDIGEKIGGARKDLATPTGRTRRTTEEDTRPTWAKRFKISQIVRAGGRIGDIKDEGRWVINDSRTLDWLKQPKQVGTSFATKEEAEAFLPIAAVSAKHRIVPTRDGKYEIWRDITDRKRVKVVDQTFATRDEAKEYMVKHAAEILDTNTTFGEADMPLPPDRARTGPERRQGDVKGEDFKDAFGLRGVEFGNWNNQDERQGLMNDAYDGLMDLAHVLGVPPKAIGLNGDLALAFGARGHGLSGARAHYEPERAVINLTKERGAGSLAHEWFHALDFYLGRQDGKASSKWEVSPDGTRTLKADVPDAASHGFSRASGVRPELRAAYDKVLQTIAKKATQYVEDTVKADNFTGRAREDLARELDGLRKELAAQKDAQYYKRNNKPASAEQLAEFDSTAKRMLEGEAQAITTDWKGVQGPKALAYRWTNDSLEQLASIYKAVRGRSGFDTQNRNGTMDHIAGAMRRYSERLKQLADAQSGAEKTRMVPTDFAMNARELDQGRGTDYWTTPHEMAARAFQGYVEDKIAQEGGVSRFLNYGPENAGILTPWGAKRPFPAGDERKAINAALDHLVQTIQTKETDKGTALYKRDRDDEVMPSGLTMAQVREKIAGLRGMPIERAQAIVSDLTKDWKGGIDVKVVASPRDLPGGAPDSAKGMYANGVGYVVASKVKTPQDVGKILAHEVIAHHGLRSMLGERDWHRLMNQIQAAARAGNPEINAARDYVRGAYVDDKGNYTLKEGSGLEADETAARLIEQSVDAQGNMKPALQWMKWVWSKVAGFLRSVGLDVPFTTAELHGIFVDARRDLERGPRQEMEPQLAAAAQERPSLAIDKDEALAHVGAAIDKVKGSQALRDVGTAWDGVLRATAPQFRSPEALEAARQIINGIGSNEMQGIRFRSELEKAIVQDDKAQTVAQKARDLLEKGLTVAADKVFLRRTPEENRAFMQAMDTGDAEFFEKNPNLKPVADTIAQMFADKAAAVKALDTGALQNVRENYFPHIWNREPSGDAQREIFTQLSKRPMEGQKGFTKERIFDDVQAGLDAGFEPVSNNPLDLVMLKMQEMDKYLLAHKTLDAMQGTDAVHLIGAGEKAPQGYTDINGRFGSIERDGQKLRYVARDDVAQVVNNYVSPSLYHNKYVGKPFTGYMKAANLLNQFQLGVFSAFHAGFTSMEAVISHASIGVKALSAGDVKGAAKYLASAPTAWIQNPRLGSKIIDALVNGADHPEMARIIEGLEMAGAKWQMDERFRTGATKEMLQSWTEGKKLQAGINAIGAITEQSARPILEWLVPRQKFGVFGEMYSKWMQDHPDASHVDLRNAAQQIWNRVDSRLGQVVYDRLFVHNVAKNFAQMLVRAPGWTGGTILEIGGGIKDLAGYARDVAMGKKPESISDRAAYTLSMLMVTAVANAALTAMFTGQQPQNWKDLVAFRTGNLDEYGRPERFMLPTYMKDVYAYSQGPGTTLVNKAHPLLSLVGDVVRNRDYMGTQIRSEDSGLLTQLAQTAGFAAKAFVPFWVKGVQTQNERQGSLMAKAAPLIGVMPSPTDLNKTEAEKLVSKYGADRLPQGSRTQQETDSSDLRRQMYVALRKGDREQAMELFRQGRQQGLLAPNDLIHVSRQAQNSPLVNGFQRLTMEQAQRVMAVATPQEQAQLQPLYLRKRLADMQKKMGMGGQATL